MRTSTKMWIATGLLLLVRTSYAQAEKESPSGFYRLDFVTKELDEAKVVNTRNYTMIVSDGKQAQIRTGSRVPMPQDRNGSVSYVDLGVSFDCRDMREVAGQFTANISVDISSASADTSATPMLPPVIRQLKWNSTTIVPLRKNTQIYSSDDVSSKHKFQIELTATPIK
jgi:hypothetical protein